MTENQARTTQRAPAHNYYATGKRGRYQILLDQQLALVSLFRKLLIQGHCRIFVRIGTIARLSPRHNSARFGVNFDKAAADEVYVAA